MAHVASYLAAIVGISLYDIVLSFNLDFNVLLYLKFQPNSPTHFHHLFFCDNTENVSRCLTSPPGSSEHYYFQRFSCKSSPKVVCQGSGSG